MTRLSVSVVLALAVPAVTGAVLDEPPPDHVDGSFQLDEVDVRYVRLAVPADHRKARGRDRADVETIELEGWVGLPRGLRDGARVPVALTSSPYLRGVRGDSPGEEAFWTDQPEEGAIRNWGVNPIELIRNGYAAAFFGIRGTGNSGGCFELFGRNEQRDQERIVDWLAEQPWSTGRVAMGGLSYRAVPPVAAAVHGAEPLETIVLAGTIFDAYTSVFTPQGAVRYSDALALDTLPFGQTSAAPPAGGASVGHLGDYPYVAPERLCPEVAEVVGSGQRAWLSEDRIASFWKERSFLDELRDVETSILLVQGFDDVLNHGFQDSPVWNLTPNAPKRQITGQWAHAYPWPEAARFDTSWRKSTWEDTLLAWLDHWLKGEGAAPRLGTADFQDGDGTWHQSASWPPAEAVHEVLYLAGDGLAPQVGDGDRAYRAPSTILNSRRRTESGGAPVQPWAALCPNPVSEATGTAGVAYISEPLEQDTLIAGDPFAYLILSSDRPGGTVMVNLAEIVGGTTECTPAGEPTNVRVLSAGAADLRFHTGGYQARPFPIGIPTSVRVDLLDLAETVGAGSRLVVAVMGDEITDEWTGQPYYPEVTVHAGDVTASQIVLPVVSGSTGGPTPSVTYPPRPFIPTR